LRSNPLALDFCNLIGQNFWCLIWLHTEQSSKHEPPCLTQELWVCLSQQSAFSPPRAMVWVPKQAVT
jgi:hypothetical protein